MLYWVAMGKAKVNYMVVQRSYYRGCLGSPTFSLRSLPGFPIFTSRYSGIGAKQQQREASLVSEKRCTVAQQLNEWSKGQWHNLFLGQGESNIATRLTS
jgi:hypothetical protein